MWKMQPKYIPAIKNLHKRLSTSQVYCLGKGRRR